MLDQELLAKCLDPFALGMSRHLSAIKYEALTPDLSCFLFTTTGEDGRDYYFILVRYDYLRDLAAARTVINDWHGEIIEFLSPASAEEAAEPGLKDYSHSYDKNYKGLLARVARPEGNGYWATNIVIHPGDDIEQKLAHLNEKQQAKVKKGLADINRPESTISIYLAPDGRTEYFF